MRTTDFAGLPEKEVDRRSFLKAAGAATVLGTATVLGGNLVLGCAPAKAPEAKAPAGYERLRMYGASLGSKTTTVVMAYANILNKYYPEIEWSSVSGTTGVNLIRLDKGDIQVCTSLPGNYIEAFGFDKVPQSRLRSISLPTPLTQMFFLIPEDKPWKDITEVPKGLTLAPGTPGTSVPVVCEAWLNLVGLSKKDFNWVPMAQGTVPDAWREGKIDFTFQPVSGIAPFLMDMHTSPRKFKAMGLSPEQLTKAKAEQTFERVGMTPAKTNVSELVPEVFKYDVQAPQAPTTLNSRDDFPQEIAYRMAKIMDEHRPELAQIYPLMQYGTPQWHIQWARPPLDIHPGVARYYREKGYLK